LNALDSGGGSLRQAIIDSNASSDPSNTIQFALSGSGVHTINLLSALPEVTNPVLIDGYSQAGSSANTRDVGDDAVLTIELNGAAAGANANGLIISAANTTVRGLVINRFGHAGVELSGPSATNDIVAGNFIGTNALGTAALRNGQGGGTGGVLLINGANNDLVGGENAPDRNLISGNNGEGVMLLTQDGADTHDNTVENNYIGTNAFGTAALGNLSSGIFVPFSGGNKVEGNLVSGNAGFAGIALGGIQPGGGQFRLGGFVSSVGDGASNIVSANLIGTDATGTAAVANLGYGVSVDGGNQMTIGGTGRGAGNLISGNAREGIHIFDNATNMLVLANRIGTDGSGAAALGNSSDGISITGGATAVTVGGAGGRNLISGNRGNGISITTGATGNVIQGNDIGTDVTGTRALGNRLNGVSVNASGNTVGGTTAGARNVISGNLADGILVISASGSLVEGNYIGTDATGNRALPNQIGVAIFSANNTIGGTEPGAGNVISGNGTGITMIGGVTNNTIQGNRIGTDATGTHSLGNDTGILLDSGANQNLIGGTTPDARNVISGNASYGIFLANSTFNNAVQGNFIGTDVTGTVALGNPRGLMLYNALGTTIGGTDPGAGNLISGNGVGVYLLATNIQVQGNFVGTDITGTRPLGNSFGGITVFGGSNNQIGGTIAGAGNLISGNGNAGVEVDFGPIGTHLQGNYIGTDVTGTAPVGNAEGVLLYGNFTTVGGVEAGASNVISGNLTQGIEIRGNNNTVQGNVIGTTVTGTQALSNQIGVSITGSNNTIGGTADGAGNVISGNLRPGIVVTGPSASGNAIQGNRIGTDVTGTLPLGNGLAGVTLDTATGITINNAPNTLIGGTADGAGNLISGNNSAGVFIEASTTQPLRTLVEGNFIGTDVTGTLSVRNGVVGVNVQSASGNTIGGTTAAARNIISANGGNGVVLATAPSGPVASGNVVEGNYIGTDVTGTLRLGNGTLAFDRHNGVEIDDAVGNVIGGTAPGAGNLISGNGNDGILIRSLIANPHPSGNLVLGNTIGTDVTGSVALGNQGDGVEVLVGSNNTIGGTDAGARNLISGNGASGVEIGGFGGALSSGNLVEGNLIGTDGTGTSRLPNGAGVTISQANANTIGGTSAATRNIISGNGLWGLELFLGASQNSILGNYVGTDVTGTQAVANGLGIELFLANGNFIGGTNTGAGNLISGNAGNGGDGLLIERAIGNFVMGNLIGTDVSGAVALGNAGAGLELAENSAGNIIGGTTAAARNLISANGLDGVLFRVGDGQHNQVQGNYIGTDATGTQALGNGRDGVRIFAAFTNNLIGGTDPGAGNVISGNAEAGILLGFGAAANQVQGNYIGTDGTGTLAVGNGGNGVDVAAGAHDNTIGGTAARAGNVIAFSGNDGVRIDTGTGNAVLHNSIFANAGLGIELVNHGNNDQPAPVLTSAVSGGGSTTIQGTFTGRASTTYRVEFFADLNTPAQGKRFLGAVLVTTDASGMANIALTIGPELDPGTAVTATATDPANNTSPFSNAVVVTR
jgi:hypothetical protein